MKNLPLVLATLLFFPNPGFVRVAVKSPTLPQQNQSANQREPVPNDVEDSELFLQNTITVRTPERDHTQRIDALLKQMTLEEKVGQMTQLTLEMIASGKDQSLQIDPAT